MTIPDEERGKALEQGLKHFTDREPFLDIFRRDLAIPEGRSLRVLAFHGVGGRGKSELIRRLGHELDRSEPPIPHARFDVETLSSPV